MLEADDALLIAGVLFGYVELDRLIENDMIHIEGTANAVKQIQPLFRYPLSTQQVNDSDTFRRCAG